jgi:hypothetical protein
MHDIYFFRTCEIICGKTRMDKFHVYVLMVKMSLDEVLDFSVLDIFSAE